MPNSLGISTISVGGDGKYLPFLYLASGLGIHWYICSDGEEKALKDIQSALKNIGIIDISSQKNIFMLPDNHKWETYFVDQGYSDVIETMLDSYHNTNDFVGKYIEKMSGQKQQGGTIRNYDGEQGRKEAIVAILFEEKTRYAAPLAHAITSLEDTKRRIPEKIREMFAQIKSELAPQTIYDGVKL